MNIAAHMQRAGRAFPEAAAIARGRRIIHTYGEVAERVRRLAFSLKSVLGLSKGDVIAIAAVNCEEYLEILYACWHAGLTAAPVNAKLHAKEFEYILNNSGARACFATSKLASEIGALSLSSMKSVIDISSNEYAKLIGGEEAPLAEAAPDDAAWLFYTSGTTGKPKGAVLTHRNLLAMSFCYFADVDQQSPWRTIVHAAPMSHGSGLYAIAHVMKASCHVIPESGGFDVAELYDLISAHESVVFFAAPTMVTRLVKHQEETDTSNLKTILYGGGPMYLEDCLAGLNRFGPKLAQLYGQGETPMTITALSAAVHADSNHPEWKRRLASVGVAQSAVEVRVVDEQDRFLPAGEVGEVVVRGDTVMREYWRNPEATAETLRNGWLHTGDFGIFDKAGFLTLKDRAKDLIISGGTNIYPREVEEVLLKHDGVLEASVIGRPDPDWGEIVIAYMVLKEGVSPDAEALDALCLGEIARFKRPKRYIFVDELPKNSYGKVLKSALREIDAKT